MSELLAETSAKEYIPNHKNEPSLKCQRPPNAGPSSEPIYRNGNTTSDPSNILPPLSAPVNKKMLQKAIFFRFFTTLQNGIRQARFLPMSAPPLNC